MESISMSPPSDKVLRLLAERQLEKESINEWAIKCLEAGFDSPNLRMLAAMPAGQYSPSEFDGKLALTLVELGWNLVTPQEYLFFFARETAQGILDGNIDPVQGSREIFGILKRIDAHSELGPWYEIDEMLWDREYFEKSGEQGYYYRDEEQLAEEIIRRCSEFLKRTKNHLLPLPETSFDEAESQFCLFLESLGVSSKVQWVFREDVLMDKMQVLIRTPLPENNRALAHDCFELGKQRNLGIAFQAAYSFNELTCCYIQLPLDDTEAQYRLMGNRNLKLSCRVDLGQAKGVSSYARWLIKGLFSNEQHNYFRLADIPSRNTLLPVSR